ncbi:MAG: trypsin-like serine protease [bacterium]
MVTASHCTGERSPESTGFGLGADPADPVALIEVAAFYTHPDLDLAVLELASEAREVAPGVVPIAGNGESLDSDFGRGLVGTPVEAAGYGETLDPERAGLWFVSLPLVDITSEYVVVDGQGERGICRGDSGGPVLATSRIGAPIILGVEHGGDASCVGRDNLTRLDVAGTWLRQVISGVIRPDGAPIGCGDLDFNGRCVDDTVFWCNEDMVPVSRSCTAEGLRCAWAGTALGFYCTTVEQTCADVGDGVCLDDRVRRFCLEGVVTDDDCFRAGLRCVAGEGTADCVDETGTPVRPKTKFNSGCCRVAGGGGEAGWPPGLLAAALLSRRRSLFSGRSEASGAP